MSLYLDPYLCLLFSTGIYERGAALLRRNIAHMVLPSIDLSRYLKSTVSPLDTKERNELTWDQGATTAVDEYNAGEVIRYGVNSPKPPVKNNAGPKAIVRIQNKNRLDSEGSTHHDVSDIDRTVRTFRAALKSGKSKFQLT